MILFRWELSIQKLVSSYIMCIYHGAVKFHIYHSHDAVYYLYSVVEEEDTDHFLWFARDRDRLRILLKTEKQGHQSRKTIISLHIPTYRFIPSFVGRIFFDSSNIAVNIRRLPPWSWTKNGYFYSHKSFKKHIKLYRSYLFF